MTTEDEREQLYKFSSQMLFSNDKKPVKITVEFQHKQFTNQKSFASIELPLLCSSMERLLEALSTRVFDVLSGKDFEDQQRLINELSRTLNIDGTGEINED
jgi:hypothetical protein